VEIFHLQDFGLKFACQNLIHQHNNNFLWSFQRPKHSNHKLNDCFCDHSRWSVFFPIIDPDFWAILGFYFWAFFLIPGILSTVGWLYIYIWSFLFQWLQLYWPISTCPSCFSSCKTRSRSSWVHPPLNWPPGMSESWMFRMAAEAWFWQSLTGIYGDLIEFTCWKGACHWIYPLATKRGNGKSPKWLF
jgi:hypothetical protein